MPSDPTRLRRILQFSIVLGLAAVLPDMGGARADCPYTNFFANAHDLPNGSTIVCPTDGIRSVPDGGELQGFFTLPNSLNWVYEQNGTVSTIEIFAGFVQDPILLQGVTTLSSDNFQQFNGSGCPAGSPSCQVGNTVPGNPRAADGNIDEAQPVLLPDIFSLDGGAPSSGPTTAIAYTQFESILNDPQSGLTSAQEEDALRAFQNLADNPPDDNAMNGFINDLADEAGVEPPANRESILTQLFGDQTGSPGDGSPRESVLDQIRWPPQPAPPTSVLQDETSGGAQEEPQPTLVERYLSDEERAGMPEDEQWYLAERRYQEEESDRLNRLNVPPIVPGGDFDPSYYFATEIAPAFRESEAGNVDLDNEADMQRYIDETFNDLQEKLENGEIDSSMAVPINRYRTMIENHPLFSGNAKGTPMLAFAIATVIEQGADVDQVEAFTTFALDRVNASYRRNNPDALGQFGAIIGGFDVGAAPSQLPVSVQNDAQTAGVPERGGSTLPEPLIIVR